MRTTILYLFLTIFSILPYLSFAIDHPKANFGIYGIQSFYNISDYQKHYIGQKVKYLPANMTNGNYYDRTRFLEEGGSYDKEYIIKKITGNNYRMTFLLEEVDGNSEVKFIVNNIEEKKIDGKYTYCITNDYSVPLFLIEKFNEDKCKYIGKAIGNGSNKLEITNVLIQKVEMVDDKSNEAYPNIVFEVTDKSDGKKSYVDANYANCLDELGQVFTHPYFNCKYTVIGIGAQKEYSYTKRGIEKIKMYTVKNSVSGITKEVEAKSAKTDAFKDDDSGHFSISLSKVEKPSNTAIRNGKTTSIIEKDINKYSYIDNFIDIIIFSSTSQFNFILKNVSDNTIKVVWNEAVFVDVDGSTSKIMHAGVKYSQREGDQPASVIIKGAKLEDIAAPIVNVYYSEINKEWESHSLFQHADRNMKGQTIKLMLPIQIKDVINEYIFEFSLNYKFDHPEYLAN